jgi:hypothetical protein
MAVMGTNCSGHGTRSHVLCSVCIHTNHMSLLELLLILRHQTMAPREVNVATYRPAALGRAAI